MRYSCTAILIIPVNVLCTSFDSFSSPFRSSGSRRMLHLMFLGSILFTSSPPLSGKSILIRVVHFFKPLQMPFFAVFCTRPYRFPYWPLKTRIYAYSRPYSANRDFRNYRNCGGAHTAERLRPRMASRPRRRPYTRIASRARRLARNLRRSSHR